MERVGRDWMSLIGYGFCFIGLIYLLPLRISVFDNFIMRVVFDNSFYVTLIIMAGFWDKVHVGKYHRVHQKSEVWG